jgi:UDP-2,3-diacylglucosamine pyrophosphatase LpxH
MTAVTSVNARRKVFIFSDWHLGGEPDDQTQGRIGTQICRSAPQITEFVDWVAAGATTYPGTTEIVINGDMVDFLAPDSVEPATEWIADQDAAIRRLDRIIVGSRGKNGRGPFEALRDFLDGPSSELTILLGNHDIELALPQVRQHITELLGNSSRLRLIYDGEPLVRGRLLVEHGNRYDSWNVIDHSRLRQERSQVARGFPIEERDRDSKYFRPPAGTYLVIYCINSILAKYPFINLLKPENEAALPLLLTLESDLRSVIGLALGISPVTLQRLYRGRTDGPATPANPGNLTGAKTATQIRSVDEALNELLGPDAELFPAPAQITPMSGAAATNRITALWSRSREIAESIAKKLDLAALAAEAVNETKFRRLEVAFQALQGNRTFDLSHESANYIGAATAILNTGKFDLVIFGHTHLPKRIEVARDGNVAGIYINTGTWADVIRLPDQVCEASVAGRNARREFLQDMAAHRVKPHLFTCLSYAEVELAGNAVTSSALHSFTKADPRATPMTIYT